MHIYSISQKWVHPSHFGNHFSISFKGQYYRNETWIYFRVVNEQLYSSKYLLSSEITQHTAIIVKKAGNKSEYTLSDNSYTSFNHAKPHVLSSCSCFCLLDRTIHICVSCLEQLKFGTLSTIPSYWPLDVQHDTSWQRTLWGFEN